MRHFIFILLILIAELFTLRAANAATLIWMIAEHNSNVGLATFDIDNLTVDLIGDVNIFMQDIAFGSGGTLYGSDGSSLFEISTVDATPTLLYDFAGGNSLAYGSDGLLYGNGGDSLVTINPNTGVQNTIGPIGYTGAGDLAFQNNKLYLTEVGGGLVEVNTTTGAGTFIGQIDDGSAGILNELPPYGLVSVNGTLFGVADTMIFTASDTFGNGNIYYDYSAQGIIGFGGGLAFDTGAVPVPASIWLFSSGLLGLVAFARRNT